MQRGLWIALLLPSAAAPVGAQPAEPPPIKMSVHPAGAPSPALKYRLLPEVRELQPGNALIAYMRACNPEWFAHAPRGKDWDELEKLREMPLDQLKKEKHLPYLPTLALLEVDRGARREYCDWEMLPRLRKDGIGTLIGDVSTMRQFAHLLTIRARLEMAEGRLDKALYTFQTMMGMGRHVAEGPTTVINDLVGVAIAGMVVEQLNDYVQQPGAPNLYWALTTLPQPLIDIHKGLETETIMVEVHFPELKKIAKGPLSAPELARLTAVCCDVDNIWIDSPKEPDFNKKLELVGKVVKSYPAARKALLDQGRKAADVDALPMLQVVVMHHYQQFRRLEDEMLKWTYVPYWQGHKARQQLREQHREREQLFPFGWFVMAAEKVHFAIVRLDRKIAALRCAEAIRLHVAETGKVPAALADITVPIPDDPVTGKAFQFTAKGDVVTLFGEAPPGVPAAEHTVAHYQITIKR
jgi:hypothetical protein